MSLSEERVAAMIGGLETPKASSAAVAGTSISSVLVVLVVTALGGLLEDRVGQRGGNVVLAGAFVAFASVVIGIAIGYLLAAVVGPRIKSAAPDSQQLCRLAAAREVAALEALISNGQEKMTGYELELIARQCSSLARFLASEGHMEERLHWVVEALNNVSGEHGFAQPDDRRLLAQYLKYLGQALDSAATCR